MNKSEFRLIPLVVSVSVVLTACGGTTPVKEFAAPVVEKVEPQAAEMKQTASSTIETTTEAAKQSPRDSMQTPMEDVKTVVEEKRPKPVTMTEPAASAPATSAAKSAASSQLASEEELKQKIAYSKMMFMSKASKRIAASSNQQAQELLEQSEQKMTQAKEALAAGDRRTAQDLIDESMRMFNSASIMVPSEAVIAEQKQRYEDLLKELDHSRDIHRENYQRMKKKDPSAAVELDAEQVDALVGEAAKMAEERDYQSAVATVDSAVRLVNNATSQMLHDQTITYELNIDTPEGEWSYELDRYLGYEELIPVAIENKKPNQGQLFLINRSVKKSEEMADTARETAASGDYPKAIAQILDATKEIRKALRLMGVTQ